MATAATVDRVLETQGLSKAAAGRSSRLSSANDLIKRALTFHAVHPEPAPLKRDDNIRLLFNDAEECRPLSRDRDFTCSLFMSLVLIS